MRADCCPPNTLTGPGNDAAIAGDMWAIKFCFERIDGPIQNGNGNGIGQAPLNLAQIANVCLRAEALHRDSLVIDRPVTDRVED